MLNSRGLRILDTLDAVSSDLGARPAQVALAWLMAKPAIAAPIASSNSLAQQQDLVAATRLVLPSDALERLDLAGV